jgi:hypothetical protein
MVSEIYKFFERRKDLWIFLIFIIFVLYAVAKNTFLNIAWVTEATGFNATLQGLLVFSLIIGFFVFSYKMSFMIERKKLLALLFITMFALQLGVWSVTTLRSTDAKGNYNQALLIAEQGPLYYLANYHTLQDTWNPEVVSHITNSFQELGIGEWTHALALNANETLDSGYIGGEYIRTALHPPLLPVYYSIFVYTMGPSSYDSFSFALPHWLLVALIPVIMYALLRRYFNKTTSIRTTFLFMLVPVMLMYTTTPVQETVMPLFFLLSAYIFLAGIEMNNNRLIMVSGVLVSIASLVKFTGLILYVPFIIVLVWKFRAGSIKKGLYFIVSSAILPALLFIVFNYNFILNLLLSKSVDAYYIELHLLAQAPSYVMPVISAYYLTYLGIPLFVLAFFGVLKMFSSYKKQHTDLRYSYRSESGIMERGEMSLLNKFSIASAIAFVLSFIILYGNFIKQLIPVFFLLSLPLAYYMEKAGDRKVYAYFSILVVQLLLFLFFL